MCKLYRTYLCVCLHVFSHLTDSTIANKSHTFGTLVYVQYVLLYPDVLTKIGILEQQKQRATLVHSMGNYSNPHTSLSPMMCSCFKCFMIAISRFNCSSICSFASCALSIILIAEASLVSQSTPYLTLEKAPFPRVLPNSNFPIFLTILERNCTKWWNNTHTWSPVPASGKRPKQTTKRRNVGGWQSKSARPRSKTTTVPDRTEGTVVPKQR